MPRAIRRLSLAFLSVVCPLASRATAAGAADPPPPVGSLGGPDRSLTADEQQQWLRGRAVFCRDFDVRDGLGPLYDADSCRACHHAGATGGTGGLDVNLVLFGKTDFITFTAYPGGLVASKLAVPPARRREIPADANVIQQRQAPALFGLGLIERLPVDVILANADPDDINGDRVSGRANFIGGQVGRFGQKALRSTLRDFVARFAGNVMGLTLPASSSSLALTGDSDAVADPELSAADFDDLLFFVGHLAPPPPAAGGDAAQIARGRELFQQLGCSACHVPQLNGPDGAVAAYSDFLLHDVLSLPFLDVVEGNSMTGEFRTAPLWGLRYTAPYLSNGSAETVTGAINGHFGEAQRSRDQFNLLPAGDSQALLAFLQSL